ncbi:cytochrome c oxidase subunit II [Noviherbaspirillum saxi]|uniref:cytochrome-c oxidase n=1 Tax=Noviherbaspirillum saxi TaxID=2320863 RepID=A0A3A3FR69_9BURK|nr:cytochrome c oxidase subunit II [Noviherbaspirillum saxi]RJF95932.1 cytochrome B [Noviherbaspirillum saxi]
MVMAISLIVIVVASLLFHVVSPWWITPLASNWKQMDDTLAITLVVTGIFFVGINLFVAYALWRYRHRDGSRAAYEPDNHKLERWLFAGTSVAIMALLAPGLFVYAEYVRPPDDALVVEALGQQWQWHYRYPGRDGKLGLTDTRHVKADNPFGLDPDNPAGHDNIVVSGDLHLPLNKPVKVLLRSNDVLHDFYVPHFRARMNIVPGMVTSFWFTPTLAGRYEILCAQLCGVGHYNMRGYVVVEDEAAFQKWLGAQPTFASLMAKPGGGIAPTTGSGPEARVAQGKSLAQSKGCIACHTIDGAPGVGPTWKGLYGKTETMTDGSAVLVDEAYLKDDILNPQTRVVKGFPPIMPKVPFNDDELAALVAYIQSLGSAPPATKTQK